MMLAPINGTSATARPGLSGMSHQGLTAATTSAVSAPAVPETARRTRADGTYSGGLVGGHPG